MEIAQVRARATAKRFDFLEKENRLATVSQLGGGMKLENLWYKENLGFEPLLRIILRRSTLKLTATGILLCALSNSFAFVLFTFIL